jgi:hypothetical protein
MRLPFMLLLSRSTKESEREVNLDRRRWEKTGPKKGGRNRGGEAKEDTRKWKKQKREGKTGNVWWRKQRTDSTAYPLPQYHVASS